MKKEVERLRQGGNYNRLRTDEDKEVDNNNITNNNNLKHQL